MRGIWQLAIAVGVVVGVVLVVSGFLVFEHGGKSSNSSTSPSRTSTNSFGSADITATAPSKPKAKGGPYQRIVVVRPKDRQSGRPIHDAKVVIHGEMTSPHYMPLYEKKLQETAPGTYKTGYTLVMPGQWTFSVVLRAKNGDATTGTLPVTVKTSGT